MGFFSKLKFWKKEEEIAPISEFKMPDLNKLDLEKPSKEEKKSEFEWTKEEKSSYGDITGIKESIVPESFHEKTGEADISLVGPAYEKHPALFEPELRHAPLGTSGTEHIIMGKDIEILSAKIDAIKATVESISHRLESMERVIMSEMKRRGVW